VLISLGMARGNGGQGIQLCQVANLGQGKHLCRVDITMRTTPPFSVPVPVLLLVTSSWVCASSFAPPEANNKSQEIGAKVTKLVPFLGHWRVHIPSGDLEMAVLFL
jgi:hypothetical protein